MEPCALSPLANGAGEFRVVVGRDREPWHAGNGRIGVTVFPAACAADPVPSKHLPDGTPVLLYTGNHIHGVGGANPWREQLCIAELMGVFVHIQERRGLVSVTVADRRLD